MPSTVYFGSPRQARLVANETLPAKLDLILEQLHLRERVKDETVAIKMHLGHTLSYSTIHPLFIRKLVQAVKEGGGHPFVADLLYDTIASETRGYSSEILGCPVYPTSGLKDEYYYSHQFPYKNIKEWRVAGMIQDATFLINFAHAKGHPSCSYGGAFKNLALGCVTGTTRSQIHDTVHYDRYWFSERCPDQETRLRIIDSCPFGAIVEDKDNSGELHLHFEPCNQCGRCLKEAPQGSLKIDPVNFWSFQEACAISASQTMSTFAPGKAIHLVLANQITPVCDCFGFTSMSILPDAGIFGSDDIVAIDTAVLDATARTPLIEENVPTSKEVCRLPGKHPFTWIHGPLKDPYKVVEYGAQLGLGEREYELIDVLPVEQVFRSSMGYIPAK